MNAKFMGILLVLLAAFGADAHAEALQMGNPALTEANIEKISAGMKADDVIQVLGRADEVIEQADGTSRWLYRRTEGKFGRATFGREKKEIKAMLLTLVISKEGAVSRVDYDESQANRN